jgi:hypothetical protein
MNAVARGLALFVLGWMVLGFGLCGAFGVVGGVASLFGGRNGGELGGASLFLLPGLLGLAIAFGAWKGMKALLRQPRTPS